MKRVLLIEENRLIGNLYRERLEAAGFSVNAASTGEAGLKSFWELQPDAVVIDPLIRSPEAKEAIASMRSAASGSAVPILVLPTAQPQLAEAARQAGASKLLARGSNPVAELIDSLEAALNLERSGAHSKTAPFQPGGAWLKTSLESVPEALNAMRLSLQSVSRDAGDQGAWRAFLQGIHGLAEEMALLGQQPVFHLAAAIERLVFDLMKLPEQANPSTLRTLGQSMDFLAVLLDDQHRTRAKDPSAAQVLVVDDEEGARMIIMAAMKLVHLKSVAADTPTAGLAAMAIQSFDLIFLDVGLPEMNGFELCSKARSLPLHEKTPIVFITGMTTFQNRVQSSLSGGNDFVGKPFSVPELGLKALIWVLKGQLGLV